MRGEIVRAARRLRGGRDLHIVLAAKLAEINELILTTPLDVVEKVVPLLSQYHALEEFNEFVLAAAEEPEDG